jgi:hypothetical protein
VELSIGLDQGGLRRDRDLGSGFRGVALATAYALLRRFP